MEIVLSILIPSTPAHKDCAEQLIISLMKQGEFPDVEILEDRTYPMVIGAKRNAMLSKASGRFVVFIDADDVVSPDYVAKVRACCYISKAVDCIGISGIITTDGRDQRQWHISKEYGSWFTGEDGTYYRTPNHISPVRRELALQAGFPEIAFGEDYQYSMRLLPLLKTEVVVPGNLYFYKYISNK